MKRLIVHPDHQYLMWEDGEPFFYMGDTAWEMFHKLNKNEIDYFLTTRAQQGFNVIQAVALAEQFGLTVPNAYGRYPLSMTGDYYDPTKPDEGNGYDYWQHVDFAVRKAAEKGLVIALLPAWGDKFNKKLGLEMEIFSPENAYIFGKWIANRYRDQWNIIWMLGGDRPLETPEHHAIVDAMGKGIREGDGGAHLITFHAPGGGCSAQHVKDKDYIDFHTSQSGHRTLTYNSWKLIREAGQMENKPFMDAEPRYEDMPVCLRMDPYLWNADDVRQNAYWNLMEGVCGHTYGNNDTWFFTSKKGDKKIDFFQHQWPEVMHHSGAEQMRHVIGLRMCRPYFEFRSAPELVEDDTAIMAHQAAARGENYAFIYSPLGMPIRAYLDKLTDKDVRAAWYNPRNGETQVFVILPPSEVLLVPPTSGKGCDWVVILDVIEPEKVDLE